MAGFTRIGVLSAATLAMAAPAAAQVWNEIDAQALPHSVEITEGAGALTSIVGAFDPNTSGNERDGYAIRITDPFTFSASTVGGATAGTRLYLFDDRGRLVVWNDDFGGTDQSTITSQGVFEAGLYYLVLTLENAEPSDSGGNLLTTTDTWPGPGADQFRGRTDFGPWASWSGSSPSGVSAYTIALTGAAFARDLAGAEDYWIPQDFTDIQSALTGAASGDTIHVTPDVYNEFNLDFGGKALTLHGFGSGRSIIDAGFNGRTIALDSFADGTVIEHMTMRFADLAGSAGGVINSTASFTVRDCEFFGNVADNTSDILVGGAGSAVIERCQFIGGVADTFSAAIQAQGAGTEMLIIDSLVQDHQAASSGPIFAGNGARITVERSVLRNNASRVGVLDARTNARISARNTLFDGNTSAAATGNAQHLNAELGGTLLAANCTFVNNISANVLVPATPAITILNSIFVSNTAPSGVIPGGPKVHRSIYPGASGDNLDVDPMFVDAAGGDYRLAPGSPAIDAGDSRFPFLTAPGATDLAGAARLADTGSVIDTGYAFGTPVIDIGAYEGGYALGLAGACAADFNGDGFINGADLGLLLGAWGACP
jgi:hypothetical protein